MTSGGSPAQSLPKATSTASPVSFARNSQILSGISPVRSLRSKSNSVKFMNVLGAIPGIWPVSMLPSKYKSRRSGGVEKVGGMGPEKLLLEKYATCRVGTRKTPEGMLPVKSLLEQSKNSSSVYDVKMSGKGPSNALSLTSKFPEKASDTRV